jgi:hypothetical protein
MQNLPHLNVIGLTDVHDGIRVTSLTGGPAMQRPRGPQMDRGRPKIRIGKPTRPLLPDRFTFREIIETGKKPLNTRMA